MKWQLPWRNKLDLDTHSEIHAYVSDLTELQSLRDSSRTPDETSRYNVEIAHMQLVLDRLLERVGEQ